MEGGGGGLSNFLTELTSQARDRPEAMFNLELKWVVGVGEGEGRGRGKGRRLTSITLPTPSLFFFYRSSPPWNKSLSLPSLSQL